MVEIAPVRGRAAWMTGAGRLAVVLLLAQACWRGAYLVRGYYVQDDFRMLQLGGSSRLTLDYLFQEYSGHLWPGDFLLAWVTARIDPMSWTLTAVFLLVLQLAAGAVMWLVLSRFMGDSWLRIPVLAVFLFSPLTLWSLQWWAQAIGYLPVTLLLLCAVWALLRRVQDDWRSGEPLAVGLRRSSRLRSRNAHCWHRWCWVALPWSSARVLRCPGSRDASLLLAALGRAGVVGGRLRPAARRVAPVSRTLAGPVLPAGELTRDFVLRTLLPGLAGGPWGGDILGGTLVPATWAVVVGGVLVGLVVVVTAVRGGSSARWGWLLLAIYVVCDIALLFGGRTQSALTLGLFRATSPTWSRSPPSHSPPPCGRDRLSSCDDRELTLHGPAPTVTAVALAITVAYVASAAVSTTHMAPSQLNAESREYVDNLRADLRANPRVVLYDGYVPDDVMISWFGDERRVSTVLANAPENPVFDLPSRAMRIPDEDGRLRPMTLAFATDGAGAGGGPMRLPRHVRGGDGAAAESVEADSWVLRLGYFTNVATTCRSPPVTTPSRCPSARAWPCSTWW